MITHADEGEVSEGCACETGGFLPFLGLFFFPLLKQRGYRHINTKHHEHATDRRRDEPSPKPKLLKVDDMGLVLITPTSTRPTYVRSREE